MISDSGSKKNKMGIKTFLINEKKDNKIGIRNKEKFIIMIGSNITTGYCWSPANADGNKYFKYLGLSDEDFSDEKEGLMGEPGYEYFIFEALKPGKTSIILHYSRPWEKNNEPLKTVKISLLIQ